tara:strand:- start:101 stop:967 length:867 start_codon:yes stop_codon:yes gene_type:complete
MSAIIDDLNKLLLNSDHEKSSYWQHYIDEVKLNFYDIHAVSLFGTFSKKNFLKNFLHRFFQYLIHGNKFLRTCEYQIYKNLCDKENRNLDQNVVRHILTLNLLNKMKLLHGNICIIGDGKANFVGGLIEMDKKIKIYSINLPEILINDYLIIKNNNILNDDLITVVKSNSDLERNDKRLFLINASDKNFLMNKNINLFVNIASMQEMKHETINEYFNIISNNKSFFYCCNREKKILPDGQEVSFRDYNWGDGKIILEENCPWHQRYYDFFPPFIKKYDGNVMHRILKY